MFWRVCHVGVSRHTDNMAAERNEVEAWRRNVIERTSSVLQEAARKIERELGNPMK